MKQSLMVASAAQPYVPDYRAIVEAQAELISLARADGTLLYVNAAYGRHFGRSAARMLGTNLFDLVPTAERGTVRALIARVLRTGDVGSGENRIQADGRERWMAWTNSRHAGPGGEPLLHSVGRDITERVAAQAALQDNRALLERTGRVAGVGGWMLEIASSRLSWTAQTRRIHEVPDDYVPTLESALAFYPPEARVAVEAAVQTSLEAGRPWDLELPLVTATGRRIQVRAVGEVEFEDGQAVRLLGAFQDITQRHELQQRVAADQRFLRQLTDALPVRIAYVDAQRRFRFVNQAHCQRFGLPHEAIVGRTRAELTGGTGEALATPHVDAAFAGQPQRFEFDETTRDGVRRRIESQLLPDLDASGQVRGLITIGIDITARHDAGRVLRELNEIFDASPDYVIQTDRHGAITYLNPVARRAAGLPDGVALPAGLNFSRFHTAESNRRFADTIVPAVKARGSWVGETAAVLHDGAVVPMSHLVIGHRDEQGRVVRYSGVMRDISEQVRSQRELERQRATLESVAQSIPAAVAVVGADQRYRFVNAAFERRVGLGKEHIVGRTVREVLGERDQLRSQPWIDRVLAGETVHFERDYEATGPAQHHAVTYVPLWTAERTTDGFVGVVQDISEQRHERKRLLQLSQLDTLTGLLNRAGLMQALDDEIAGGGGASLGLLYIDLDRFKPVNDTHGHPVGDQLLRAFGQRLREQVRPSDPVARLGGDEFVVLLKGIREAAHADAVGAKVAACARLPFAVGALRLAIGASVGVAFGVAEGQGAGELLERADAMLYRVKQAGRGTHASHWDHAL